MLLHSPSFSIPFWLLLNHLSRRWVSCVCFPSSDIVASKHSGSQSQQLCFLYTLNLYPTISIPIPYSRAVSSWKSSTPSMSLCIVSVIPLHPAPWIKPVKIQLKHNVSQEEAEILLGWKLVLLLCKGSSLSSLVCTVQRVAITAEFPGRERGTRLQCFRSMVTRKRTK